MTPIYYLCLAVALSLLLARLRAPFVVAALPIATFGVVVVWRGTRDAK